MFDNNNMNNYSNINNQNGDSKKMILPIVIIVVVIIIGIGMGVGIFFLVGPGKETAEMKLCKNVNLQVENYNQDKISYSQFFENIMPDYNSYCNDKENDLCSTIKTYNEGKEKLFEYQELEDCSIYTNNDMVNRKDLCEATNNLRETENNNRENVADAHIREIKMLCDMVNE